MLYYNSTMEEQMAFGDDIGGLKYVNFGRVKGDNSRMVLDDGSEQKKDYIGSPLNNDTTRFVTRLANVITQSLLVEISEVLDKALETEVSVGTRKPAKWEELRTKLEELYIENRDLSKSIGRGFRDLLAANAPKTAFLEKVKTELLEPLRDYIQAEESVPDYKRKELASEAAKIYTNWFTQYKGRG